MIQHLEGYILSASISKHVMQSIDQVHDVLNKPISDQSLNIVGTSQPYNGVQLYGWKSPIAEHKDSTGMIFFMPLSIMGGTDFVVCQDKSVQLEIGHLYLLDDTKPHHTIGRGNVVALFFGAFQASELNEQLYKDVLDQFISFVH